MSYLEFPNKIYVVSRPGRRWRIHYGVYLPGYGVFHNTIEKGEHLSTLEEFADGETISFLEAWFTDPKTVTLRIFAMLEDPKPWSIFHACDDSMRYALFGG